MVIAFHFLDLTDNSIKKVYFKNWEDRIPFFSYNKKFAKCYWCEKLAQEDLEKLKQAKSEIARTISIRLESGVDEI